MGDFLNTLALDPNLVYLALVTGIWLGITAAYIPGTFLPEIAAFVVIAGSLVALTTMPVSWLAAGVLIVGLSLFLLMPLFNRQWGRFAEIGLIFQAIGGFFLFAGSGLVVSPWLIAASLVVAVGFNRLILLPTMRSLRDYNEYDESLQVIGMRGRVVKDLDPVGTVYVNKELWRARSQDLLTKDSSIIVTGQQGLELIVEKAKRDEDPLNQHDALPNGHMNGVHRQS